MFWLIWNDLNMVCAEHLFDVYFFLNMVCHLFLLVYFFAFSKLDFYFQLVSLVNPSISVDCEILRDCYESFAMYCFGRYLVACLGVSL